MNGPSTTVTILELLAAALSSGALATMITAWISRRPTMLKAFTASYTELSKRLATVEAKLAALERELEGERKAHQETKHRLHLALRYIRAFLTWASGDRLNDPPELPDELVSELDD